MSVFRHGQGQTPRTLGHACLHGRLGDVIWNTSQQPTVGCRTGASVSGVLWTPLRPQRFGLPPRFVVCLYCHRVSRRRMDDRYESACRLKRCASIRSYPLGGGGDDVGCSVCLAEKRQIREPFARSPVVLVNRPSHTRTSRSISVLCDYPGRETRSRTLESRLRKTPLCRSTWTARRLASTRRSRCSDGLSRVVSLLILFEVNF
jgi:hypothetical protein